MGETTRDMRKRKIKNRLVVFQTNLNNNLRIIFAIDYRRPNSRGVYDFKLITAIVSEDFRTDDRPFTQKFFIR